jgi:cytochrome c oxidase assembly protein subunit 15
VTSAPVPAHPVPDRSGPFLDRFRPVWRDRAVVANLVAQILIVVTGGLVRLTASGLGCSSWPSCTPGHFTPTSHPATSYHAYIEFGNRTVTGLLVVVAVAVVVLAGFDRSRSAGYRGLAWVPLAGVLVQAVIGGMAVRYELPPALVGSHMLISMVLVAASAWLWVRSGEGDAASRWLVTITTRALAAVLCAMGAVVVVLGVVTTGAGPHSGDDQVGYRFAIDPLTMARVHAASVWVFVAVLALVIYRLQLHARHAGLASRPGTAEPTQPLLGTTPAPPDAAVLRAGYRVLGVTLGQAVIGYVQVATHLPVALVNLHMLGAAALVVALTLFVGRLRARGLAPAPEVAPDTLRVTGTAPA